MELTLRYVEMKRIIIACFLLAGFMSCNNQDQVFPDYGYTAGYFPYQHPVRTLLLGNDILYDNSNDNAHKFVISTTMGGVYKNSKDRVFTFRIDESLCDNVSFRSTGKPVRMLPANYYSLSSPDKITIRSGDISGGVEVQLTDAFFNDPEAIDLSYVIPLRIVGVEGLDSVLMGSSSLPAPDPRVAADWNIRPKDFTMFAVKFRNPYDGTFLHRGKTTIEGSIQETIVYREKYVENDDVRTVTTSGKNQVALSAPARIPGKNGTIHLRINFPDGSMGDADCSIGGSVEYDAQSFAVTGSGRFAQGKESWGGKERDVLYLNFQAVDEMNNMTLSVTDTLVLRDRNMELETYELAFP